jgi:hypothetical protein
MINQKIIFSIFLILTIILSALVLPALAQDYSPGVTPGQYVKYGNFSGNGQGFEAFNDYGFLQLEVTSVSGKQVTLLSTGQYKNGTALSGNGTAVGQGCGCFIYFPLDIPNVVRKIIRLAKPDVFIMVETELWPNFLKICQKNNIKVNTLF